MSRQPSSTALAGTILISFALLGYLGWAAWTASRIWVPLDIRISLAQGHIRTSEFEINVAGDYKIVLDPSKPKDRPAPCLTPAQCSVEPSALATSWSLSKEKSVVARGSSDLHREYYFELGTFKAEKGHYFLDLDVSKYGSRFNAGPISLYIQENGSLHSKSDAHLAQALFVTLACVFLGSMLILNGLVVERREKLVQLAKAFSFTQPGPQPPTVLTNAPLPVSPEVPSASRAHYRYRLGAILMLAGVLGYVSVHHWMTTRSFTPVDMPISLKPGHLRTGPFLINLTQPYTISFTTDQMGLGHPDCAYERTSSSPYGEPRLRTRRILYRNGQVSTELGADAFSPGYFFHFDAEPGIYDLDVEVLADVSCLDSFHPRLRIRTDRTDYDGRAFSLLWACTLCAGTGASLLAMPVIRRYPRPNILVTPFTRPDAPPVNLRWKVLPKRWQAFSAAAWFGLITVNVQVPLLFVLMEFQPVYMNSGLPVRIFRAEKTSQPIPGLEPVLVRMDLRTGDSHPELYINSVLVPWDNFEEHLQKALNRCPPEWPVYIEGDPELEWGAVVSVVDRIQGLHVPVTMLSRRRTSEKSK